MLLPARLVLTLLPCLALLPACGDSKGTGEESSTTAPLTTTGDTPTTTTGDTPTTTGDASSSTGVPAGPNCVAITDESACAAEPDCLWKGIILYLYGAQGCSGSITNFCVDRTPAGAASAWYRGEGNDIQVVEFGYTPDDLGPEWTQCGCDGPLACLCTSITETCPERLGEFCGGISTSMGCNNANVLGDARCSWLSVSPEGPPDTNCEDDAQVDVCLPADNAADTMCMPPAYTFGNCAGYNNEIFWREVNGVVEITTACGPQPLGFTKCEGDDTPDQPDECRCRCL
jgi:hypothetical protein